MKRIIIILAFLICGIVSAQNPAYFFNGRVDVPRTTAQILATASPVEGLAFMSSDTGTIWYYDGSVWKDSGNPLIDASGFSGNLTTSVVDLQLLAEAVDSLTISGNLIPVTQAEYDLLTPTEIQENDYAIVGEGDSSGGGATGDSGTTGLILKGSTSGTHTVGIQQWSWSRSGNIVNVYITLQTIGGSSVGPFEIELGGTTIPSYGTNYPILNVQAYNLPINFYSIHARFVSASSKIVIHYQDALDGTNQMPMSDMNFASPGSFVISGTYITND